MTVYQDRSPTSKNGKITRQWSLPIYVLEGLVVLCKPGGMRKQFLPFLSGYDTKAKKANEGKNLITLFSVKVGDSQVC